jgi:hypothetical protein
MERDKLIKEANDKLDAILIQLGIDPVTLQDIREEEDE